MLLLALGLSGQRMYSQYDFICLKFVNVPHGQLCILRVAVLGWRVHLLCILADFCVPVLSVIRIVCYYFLF